MFSFYFCSHRKNPVGPVNIKILYKEKKQKKKGRKKELKCW